MNKPQRKFLKGLAKQAEEAYLKKFGKPMIYIAVEKRKVPKPMRQGGFDVTAEKVKYEVNHFRRLKRNFVKYGVDGVFDYLKECGFTHDKKLLENLLA